MPLASRDKGNFEVSVKGFIIGAVPDRWGRPTEGRAAQAAADMPIWKLRSAAGTPKSYPLSVRTLRVIWSALLLINYAPLSKMLDLIQYVARSKYLGPTVRAFSIQSCPVASCLLQPGPIRFLDAWSDAAVVTGHYDRRYELILLDQGVLWESVCW